MKYLSLFSGIGGFEYGIEEAIKKSCGAKQVSRGRDIRFRRDKLNTIITRGKQQWWQCIGYAEIDRYAKSIYRRHYPEHPDLGDATTIDTGQLPDFDLLVGGFPCQSFSVAGKRKGFLDVRGTLFFEIARILSDKRPRYFLIENVQGLLSNENGETFKRIITVLTDIGYRVSWQVLNTADYGIPQNRERIFIAGCLGGKRGPEVFPIAERGRQNAYESREKQTGESRVSTIDSRYGQRWSTETYVREKKLMELTEKKSQGYRVYNPEGLATSIASEAGGLGAKTGLYEIRPVLTPDRPEPRQHGRRFKNDGEPAFTQTGQDIHGVAIGEQIRRLTPVECERLQGFPDGWTEYGADGAKISDTQRYKCLGNAVSTNVISKIIGKWFL